MRVSMGTLDLSTTSQTQATLIQAGGTVQNGTITVGTYQLTGCTLASDATVQATTALSLHDALPICKLSGLGTLTKSTGGLVTLTGANDYTGGTVINGGTLAL